MEEIWNKNPGTNNRNPFQAKLNTPFLDKK